MDYQRLPVKFEFSETTRRSVADFRRHLPSPPCMIKQLSEGERKERQRESRRKQIPELRNGPVGFLKYEEKRNLASRNKEIKM